MKRLMIRYILKSVVVMIAETMSNAQIFHPVHPVRHYVFAALPGQTSLITQSAHPFFLIGKLTPFNTT